MTTQIDNSLADAFPKLKINDEDHELIESLVQLSKKSPKLVRSTEYEAPADPSIMIRSWKMNEFKYYDIPSPFPTLARGLFTSDVDVNGETKHVIVARGYDKFFNIGEVPWTTWASLEAHTRPPYTLTLKANGCIIFIAALTPTKVVVTSKHSIGPVNGNDESHAMVGERWLRRHLATAGKTEEQLAKRLWEEKWTAIAELCDDSFEEHVLRISKENTGLHLHGINECRGEFRTMLPDMVDAFAREFGFIVTPSMQLKTIAEVREYTEQVGKTGIWRGEALEGFVVRTHVSEPPSKPGKGPSASPYALGSSFFFKVKFDEPYMMYRDWREVTKTLLSKGPKVSNLPKSKMQRPETRAYANWIIGEIKRDRNQFDQFTKGRGIIATRERFLEWFRSEQGKVDFVQEERVRAEKEVEKQTKPGKTIIVPVAIPGCGKTTISVALSHLFGFGHTQSDNVKVKKSAPVFIKNVVNLLRTHDVVIADKNNHLRQHREQLREAAKKSDPPARLMALNWAFDLPRATIHRICGDRVFERGDKHQTLHADVVGKQHEDVIWQFLHGADELHEDEVDVSVDMNVEESMEDTLARAVDACVRILKVEQPSAEKMGEALAVARGYHSAVSRNTAEEKEKKTKVLTPRYYAFLPEIDLEDLLEKRFAAGDVPREGVDFFAQLKENERLSNRSHITIVHEKSLPEQQSLWDRCKTIFTLSSPPTFVFKLGSVIWNDRVMAVSVSDFSVSEDEEDVEGTGADFVARLPDEVRDRLHITVGTANGDIAPVEARDLISRWKYGEKTASCELEDIRMKGRIKGLRG